MQSDFAADQPHLRRRDQADAGDLDRMQLALDLAGPEVQEPAQYRKVGRAVEMLPDEALQQVGVVGHVIENLGSGQPIARKLASQFSRAQRSEERRVGKA